MTLEIRAPSLGERLRALIENVQRVIYGKAEEVRLCVVGLLAEGHVLLEDVPGTGKTSLARALAASVDVDFRRIQFTSDLLPADLLGVSVYAPERGEFVFRPGPVFGSVVLADELNRTTPRTQSALLECMDERRVSVEGETRALPRPFLVIATQNPLEFEGTYPLPESQLDRFLLRVRLGYPSREAERDVLRSRLGGDPIETLGAVMGRRELLATMDAVREVVVAERLLDYALDLVAETRRSARFLLGASPRAAIGWVRAAQAMALTEGRDFCVPDDFKRLALPVLAHRVLAVPGAGGDGAPEDADAELRELVERMPVPS